MGSIGQPRLCDLQRRLLGFKGSPAQGEITPLELWLKARQCHRFTISFLYLIWQIRYYCETSRLVYSRPESFLWAENLTSECRYDRLDQRSPELSMYYKTKLRWLNLWKCKNLLLPHLNCGLEVVVKQPVGLLRFLDPLLETPSNSGKTINKEDAQHNPRCHWFGILLTCCRHVPRFCFWSSSSPPPPSSVVFTTIIIITRPSRRDRGSKTQIKREPFGVFSMSHFGPPSLSSDINQPGTTKNHKTKPGIMKNRPWTMNNHRNPPGIMKNRPGPLKTMNTDLEPRKLTCNRITTWKTNQEPWKTNQVLWKTMKNNLELYGVVTGGYRRL